MSPEPADPCIPHLLTAAPSEALTLESGLMSIVVLLILIFVNGFFAACEIAVISVNDAKMKKMAEAGDKRAKNVIRLTENTSRFLSTIQIGITLAGFLTSASASQSFAGALADVLFFLPFPRSVVETLSMVIITIILSYFNLILGELVPKKLAMHYADGMSLRVAGFLNGVATAFRPFIALLTVSTNGVLKLLGIDPNANEDEVTEEGILMMVDAGEESGVIDGDAKDMIENIFDFSDSTVGEIMTPRTEITAIEDTCTVEEAAQLSMKFGYSRIPVYHEDLDTILGIIYAKDLLGFIGKDSSNIKLTDLMRKAYFIPESKLCSDLFKEMTEKRIQIAIIVDEYGGTEGLVSLEDLLESIVGNIQDEYDNEDEEIHKVNDHTYTVDGFTNIDEVSELIEYELPDGDYDTIAGFVVERLGYIPHPGEHPVVTEGPFTFTVQEVEDKRISKILIVHEAEAAKQGEGFGSGTETPHPQQA